MRTNCLSIGILSLSTTFVLGADGSSAPRTWSGQYFGTRQYPSINELQSIALKDLLQLRPPKIAGAERTHFEDLFNNHRDVINLKPELIPNHDEFVQKWVDLWGANSTGPHGKKLYHTIAAHFQRQGYGEDLFKEIKQKHDCAQAVIGAIKLRHKRRTSDEPESAARRERDMEQQRRYSQERRKGVRGTTYGASLFEGLLKEKSIPTTLPAIELERATRDWRDALGDVQRTTLHLRQFLTCRDKKEEGIKMAMLNRKTFNYSILRAKINEKQRIVDYARRSRARCQMKRKSSIGKRGSAVVPDSQYEAQRCLQAALVGQSRWWTK